MGGEDAADEAQADAFFADCHDPWSSAAALPQLHAWLAGLRGGSPGVLSRPLAVVTSGGTTVPLERRCVRYIDNFSKGTRGALSTEQFLQAGYAVVHLYRDSSEEPFTHGLPAGSLLGLLQGVFELDGQQGQPLGDRLAIAPGARAQVAGCLQQAQRAQQDRTLCSIKFNNLFEYLQSLRSIALALQPYGPQVLFYMAAAVSDFYAPWSQLAEHKIQSSDGDFQLTLQKVPKMLGLLTRKWAPASMVISFKLETDQGILVRKAAGALHSYGVHAVIANLLHTRKDRVLVVAKAAGCAGEGGQGSGGSAAVAAAIACAVQEQQQQQQQQQQPLDGAASAALGVQALVIDRPASEPIIERELVAYVVVLHRQFMQAN